MKKILAIALAAMMLIGCAVFASAAETTLPDSDGTGWWVNHTEGIEVTEEGFTATFTSTTYADAANNWNGPLAVVYGADEAKVNGAGYVEYWVQRVDQYGFCVAAGYYGVDLNRWSPEADLAAVGISVSSVDSRTDGWANFLADMQAGIECTVTGKLEDGKVVLTFEANGINSTTILPVDTSKTTYVSLFAELATLTNIVVSTPDAEAEAPIADGDNVKIYFPKNETFISANANDNGKKLLEANEEEAAVFSVAVDENGYYSFICDGKYLTSGETGNSLTLADAASDYSLWTLEAAENGWFVKSVNASYNGSAQYLEYYSGFTTYGKKDTADVTLYTYQFVVVEEEEAPVTVQGCLKYADADYWPATAGDCFFEYTGPGTYTIKLENISATYGAGLDMAYMFYIEFADAYQVMKDLKVSEMTILVDGEPIEVNLDYLWTYESLGTDGLPTGAFCIEIYNGFGYSGAGYGAAIDPNIFADESIEITFTLVDPNAPVEPVPPTGDAIFAVLSILCVSGMGLTAVAFNKKK